MLPDEVRESRERHERNMDRIQAEFQEKLDRTFEKAEADLAAHLARRIRLVSGTVMVACFVLGGLLWLIGALLRGS
jgi:F0F1-type ATP synthase membrane subunit b/b'